MECLSCRYKLSDKEIKTCMGLCQKCGRDSLIDKLKISVIVTTKSNAYNINRLTNSLKINREKIYEYIVVDAGTPDLSDALDQYPGCIVLDGSGSNRGEGKNIGIRYSSGDIIVFLNDDTEISYDYFDEINKWIPYFGIIAGYSRNPIGADMPRVPCFIDGNDISYPTCNLVVRSKVFNDVGLFDGSFITAEDIDFNYRCIKKGYSIFFNPKMIVNHYHRSSVKGFLKQSFWNGYGRRQLNRKYDGLKHEHGIGFRNILRLGSGFLGYILGDLFK